MNAFARVSPDVPYRSANHTFDELYGVPIRRFASVDDLEFDTRRPARYSIHDDQYTLPFDALLIPRDHSRLMVGLHGAENTRYTDSPKFQFVRSFAARNESALFLADPTILQSEPMGLGWMAGNRDTPVADVMATIVKRALAALGAEETVLVGHSAGGFAAVLLGSALPNSHAIAMNGQSVVGRYLPFTVQQLHEGAFPECSSVAEMLSRYAARLDLREALRHRAPNSSFTWYAHVDDRLSFADLPHFPLLAEHFGLGPEGGYTDCGDAFVPSRWVTDNPSAHALPGTANPFIQTVLGETPDFEIEYFVPPLVWSAS